MTIPKATSTSLTKQDCMIFCRAMQHMLKYIHNQTGVNKLENIIADFNQGIIHPMSETALFQYLRQQVPEATQQISNLEKITDETRDGFADLAEDFELRKQSSRAVPKKTRHG